MSSSDAIIWNLEDDPRLRSTIMAVWHLDAEPDPDRMRDSVDRMVAAIPRLTQRVESGWPRPEWVPIGGIDLDRHYFTEPLDGDLLDYAQRWVREPFDRAAPLWGMALLTGLADGSAAIVIKVHHSIADGLGLVQMLAAFTDLERDPTPAFASPAPDTDSVETERKPYSRRRRAVVRARRAITPVLRRPIGAIANGAKTLWSAIRLVTPNRTPLSPMMTERSETLCLDRRTVTLADLRAASKPTGASINDAYVAIVSDATARYHAANGADTDRLRFHVPVNARTERTASLAGNEFVPARISLRNTSESSVVNLVSISDQLAALRAEPALHHVNTISASIQRLGKPIANFIIGGMMRGVDVLASNVPGPPFPLYVGGVKIEEFHAFGPPAGAAINVTLFSYDGNLNLGVTTDAAAVTDRALFLECLDEAIAGLLTTDAPIMAIA